MACHDTTLTPTTFEIECCPVQRSQKTETAEPWTDPEEKRPTPVGVATGGHPAVRDWVHLWRALPVRTEFEIPRFRSAASVTDARVTPAARQAARVEAARARVCAAARRADPIDVEAAGRAYGVAITLASFAQMGRRFGAVASGLWRRARGRGASSSSATRVDA